VFDGSNTFFRKALPSQFDASYELCITSRESVRFARELMYQSRDALKESAALLKVADRLVGRPEADWPGSIDRLFQQRRLLRFDVAD